MGQIINVKKCICIPDDSEKTPTNTQPITEPISIDDFSDSEISTSSSSSSMLPPGTSPNNNTFNPKIKIITSEDLRNYTNKQQRITPITNNESPMFDIPEMPTNTIIQTRTSMPEIVYNKNTLSPLSPLYNPNNVAVTHNDIPYFNKATSHPTMQYGNMNNDISILPVTPSPKSKEIDESDLMDDNVVFNVHKRVSKILASNQLPDLSDDDSSSMDENERLAILKAKKKEKKRLSKLKPMNLTVNPSLDTLGSSETESDIDINHSITNNKTKRLGLETPHGRLIRDKSKANWTEAELDQEKYEMTKHLINLHTSIEGKDMQAELFKLKAQNSDTITNHTILINNEFDKIQSKIDINAN